MPYLWERPCVAMEGKALPGFNCLERLDSNLPLSLVVMQQLFQLAISSSWVLRSASWAARISGSELRRYSTQVLIFASRY